MKDLEIGALILFLGIVLSLFLLIWRGLKVVSPRKRNIIAAAIMLWLGILYTLAYTGFFKDFMAVPPHILVSIIPPLLFMVIMLSSKWIKPFLANTPVIWLIAPQVFRVFVELFIWMLYKAGIAPVQMTFDGRNLDILTGLTAPLVAYLYIKANGKAWGRAMAIVWNIAGLGLLINIISIAMLSTPSPMRVFMNEPANTFIGQAPYIWLPGFVVTCAYYLHALSLKQLLGRK